MSVFVITIDGPSGSGKGTLAGKLAQHYGYHFLDSGALYRLLGLAAGQASLLQEPLNLPALEQLAASLDIQFRVQDGQGPQILLNGQDVTDQIRTEEVGSMASKVAVIPSLREALFKRQRDFAKAPGLVADGRDMGTVVFPEAPAKIYLTASAEARATRRVKQLQGMGVDAKIDAILADLQARDKRDMERTVAPLKPAHDALVIDSSDLSIDQVLKTLIDYIDSKH
ncbi:cytidylate kinase [Alkanindiges hydrocarboniclasticus]|jgi:cytidylate kinase|uniref:Cytidylate kinase n=1 Tax=Alkanindiges hydrocarboniclasticus TaxID=1907941 RepID=A0A1S8CTS0_9GAMM|nr:(d)CMP kinase [Alkanindiges hydrocarboniclasticus]ONG38946.1 cytidylate kinase [Alkanindiges hydrocarboniclasticus]